MTLDDSMITLLGDIAFTGILSIQPEKNSERFKEVAPLFSQGGLVFANLEVPILVGDEVNKQKKLLHYSLQEPTEDLLKMLNVGCVSLANNHIYDYKMPSLIATIETLDKLGIHHTGAGWKKEHIEPVIINHKGKSIGFIAYVDLSTNPKTELFTELFINYFDVEQVAKDIERLKPKVDTVICSIHWGKDYSYYPTPKQREVAWRLIDAGASIIMGHHPHTLQPYEEYNGGQIFYSLGGLTFGDFYKADGSLTALNPKTKKGIIVQSKLKNLHTSFIVTKELKGNYVKVTSQSYENWSLKKWKLFTLKESSEVFKKCFNFQEQVVDIVRSKLFAYYQNPFKEIVRIENYRKLFRRIKQS